jgi:MFS family permease
MGVFAPRHRALTFGILLTITAIAWEGMAVATVLPGVALDLGGLDGYGWAFSAFMLASLVGAIAAGEIADRRGPYVPAVIGFACFSAGLIAAGSAPTWPSLLLGRCLQGFGAGNLMATSYVAIARGYPEQLRPRLMALLSSAWIVPSLVGPAIAGQVAEHWSWRLVFLGILPATAIGALMLLPPVARLKLEDSLGRVRSPSRVPTSLRLSGGLGLVLLAVGLESAPIAFALGTLGVVLAAPALRSLLPPGTFSGRVGLPSAVALRGLLAFGFFSSEALIPLGLSTQRGLPPSMVGLALTAGALAWVGGSWLQARAESRAGGSLVQRALRAAGGLVLIPVGMCSVAAVILNPTLAIELVVVGWGVSGLGMGLAYPATTLTALAMAASGEEGSAASALQVAETVGTAAGTGAAGALVALAAHLQRGMSDGLAWGFLLAVASMLVALAPALRLAPDLRWPFVWRLRSALARRTSS